MTTKWYEKGEYHEFLVSRKRDNYIPNQLYSKLIQQRKDNKKYYVLDFGTGLGHVALLMGQLLNHRTNYHIYACEHQDTLLDHLWYTITKKGIKNITPLFLPGYSKINFPKWLPRMDHIICSLSLSASENPKHILETIHKIALDDALFHIIEWNGNCIPPEIEHMMPKESKLDFETLEGYLRNYNYKTVKVHSKSQYFYAITVQISKSDESS